MCKIKITKTEENNQPGVYAIINTRNGKIYIGSTVSSMYQRWHTHLTHLRSGRHHNKHLQYTWDKNGELSFLFAVIETCEAGACVGREQSWIDHYQSTDPSCGYNIAPIAANCLGIKRSAKTKAKLTAYSKNRTPQHQANLLAALQIPAVRQRMGSGQRGKPKSEETKQKLSDSLRGRKLTEEHRGKIGAANHVRSDEVRQKLSKARKGKKCSVETKEKMSKYHRNRDPKHQAKITAGIRAAWARKRAEQVCIPTSF